VRTLQIVRTSTDGTALVLSDRDGNEFALRIDETLSGALRGDRPVDGQLKLREPGTFDVRAVQAAVRGGLSTAEVAEAYGLDEARVARYAAPIMDERRHVAEQAREALARTDAFDGRLVTVQSLLDRHGDVADIDAWRREDGRWVVKARVEGGNGDAVASWLLDSARRSATPMDETADALARLGEEAILAQDDEAPSPVERSMHVVSTAGPAPIAPGSVAATTEDERSTGPVPVVADDVGDPDEPTPPKGPRGGRARARRRAQPENPSQASLGLAESSAGSSTASTTSQPSGSGSASAGPVPRSTTAGSAKTGRGVNERPAVPSWDELMFGRREA
jgi:hypothetical protein